MIPSVIYTVMIVSLPKWTCTLLKSACTMAALLLYYVSTSISVHYDTTTILLRPYSDCSQLWSHYDHTMVILWSHGPRAQTIYSSACITIPLLLYYDSTKNARTTLALRLYYYSTTIFWVLCSGYLFAWTTTALRLYYYFTTILGVYQRLSIFADRTTTI